MSPASADSIPINRARDLLLSEFGLTCRVSRLPGDRDLNFLAASTDGRRYVLKITGDSVKRDRLEFENNLLQASASSLNGVEVSQPVPSRSGEKIVALVGDRSQAHARLMTWVDGTPLAGFRPHTRELLRSVGRVIGDLSRTLAHLDLTGPETFPPSPEWSLENATQVVEDALESIRDRSEIELLRHSLASSSVFLDEGGGELKRQILYYDANDHNLLVRLDDKLRPEIGGLIDFGDAGTGFRIADLAIAAAYAMLDKPDPIGAACQVIEGFAGVAPISEAEANVLFDMIVMRLSASVAISSRKMADGVADDYAMVSARPAWSLLAALKESSRGLAQFRIRNACGHEADPNAHRVRNWLRENGKELTSVFEADLGSGRLVVLDLTPGSTDPVILKPEREATRLLFNRIERQKAVAAIGRYGEARLIYSDDRYDVESSFGPEKRTIHLGIDVFFPPGTPVLAPLDATVHSVVGDAGAQGFGTVVILRHQPENGPVFYTLYGHLSEDDLSRLAPGDRLDAGSMVGRLGAPAENGGWTPHLHFQILTNLLDRDRVFPGVAPVSSREVWTSVCPDPNLILRIQNDELDATGLLESGIATGRQRHLSPSLSLSYDRPLHIERGIGTRLFDSTGRSYLDCVNNVAHVGHSHPAVVKAATDQMSVLNTNTRYLHANIVEYAERLKSLFPPELDTCFFVNSGSEANDLALRIARTYTGHESMIVLDGAYHGNLSSLVRLSPYKFDGPGGAGKEDGVFVAARPDSYRGIFRGPGAGERYTAEFESVLADADRTGGAAAFLFESIMSCGGQVDPPSGYLNAACGMARRSGTLCIADEVQVGFGRVGAQFWAFSRAGITPDIVTLGKPIGNGHPLGAVVTRREIAERFDNGMEYFNTFGGNPVSCAVGLAVLDVIESEELQANAETVGAYLHGRLESLKRENPVVGDVRGAGLFLGVELVLDPVSREPASSLASYLVNRARELGVLLSTDGPDRNVIKIKPPITFTTDDADHLAETVRAILQDSAFKG